MSLSLRLLQVLLLAPFASGWAAAPVAITVGYQPYDTISYSAAIVRERELWKSQLPPGSTVSFRAAPRGSVIVQWMAEGQVQIGYLGDMPALVATSITESGGIDLVASTGFSSGQRCNVLMVRADAPKFASTGDALRWLDGKVLAAPAGSCAERFLRLLVDRARLKPAQVLDESLDAIGAGLRARTIDAAVVWEPTASRIGDLVGDGAARIVVTGHTFGVGDAGVIAMRRDFVTQHREIALGWLRAELAAQQFLLQVENREAVARIVAAQARGLTARVAWFSLYGAIPPASGGSAMRDEKPFVFDPRVRAFFQASYSYLHAMQRVPSASPRTGSIDDSLAHAVLRDARLGDRPRVIVAAPIAQGPR